MDERHVPRVELLLQRLVEAHRSDRGAAADLKHLGLLEFCKVIVSHRGLERWRITRRHGGWRYDER